MACCRDPDRTRDRWKKIKELFQSLQYKGDKKKIIAKLDDDNYAAIHYAVRWNNLFVCKQLLSNEYQCSKNELDFFIDNFFFFVFKTLIYWVGMVKLRFILLLVHQISKKK